MPWKLTECGEYSFKGSGLMDLLSHQSKDWIPEGASFVVPGMGVGHFYREASRIFYNKEFTRCFFDTPIAEWVK